MTRPPFPSPPLAVSDQLDRSPAVATLTMTTTLVAGADTTPADRKLPGQSWYTVGDASHQDYNGLQPFYSCSFSRAAALSATVIFTLSHPSRATHRSELQRSFCCLPSATARAFLQLLWLRSYCGLVCTISDALTTLFYLLSCRGHATPALIQKQCYLLAKMYQLDISSIILEETLKEGSVFATIWRFSSLFPINAQQSFRLITWRAPQIGRYI